MSITERILDVHVHVRHINAVWINHEAILLFDREVVPLVLA